MLTILKNIFGGSKKIKPGDVFLFSGRASLSKIIALATNSPFSHAGIAFDETSIFEAEIATGVTQTNSLQRILNYDGDVWCLPLRKSTYSIFQKFAFQTFLKSQKSIGEYDFSTLIRLILERLKEKGVSIPSELEKVQEINSDQFAVFLSRAWIEQNKVAILTRQEISKFTCSSLVAKALQIAKVLPENIQATEVSPADLCEFCIYESSYTKWKGDRNLPFTYNTKILR